MPGRRSATVRRRCRGEDAQLIAARAVPPASVARLLAAWCGPAEWRSVQGESPAPRGVKSEQGSVEPCDDLQEPSGSCIARVQTSL